MGRHRRGTLVALRWPPRPHAATTEEPEADEIRLVALGSIAPASVRWLGRGYVPLGAVTLLVGDGGLGKSTLALELAARLTRGQVAGDLYGTPAAVAVATAEDAVAEVVRPRAEAAGADLDLVHVVTVERDGTPAGLLVPDDAGALRAVLREHRVRLLVIDPLVAFFPETVNAHRDQDVRRALVPLVQLAEADDLAVVAVVHLNKGESARIATRINASVGFHNAARSVLLVGPDPADREGATRVLVHAKCNLGEKQSSFRFRIEPRAVVAGDQTIKTSGIVWCGKAVGVSSAEVLSTPEPERDSAIAEAVAWLREELARGPVESTTLLKQAEKELGISERTLQRARVRLGAVTKKESFSGGWVWSLPDQGDTETDPTPINVSLSPWSPWSPSSPPITPRRLLSSVEDRGGVGTRARAREEGVHNEVDGDQRSTSDPFGPTPPPRCGVCGGRDYHRAGDGWTCSTCHPPVERGEEG
jgi:hypothetical protein